MRPLTRITPALPVGQVKTYSIAKPAETHTRPASCAEVGCALQEGGWKTTVDEATELGARQAFYIRRSAGRRYLESKDGPLTVFTFPPGEECFTAHRIDLDRPEVYSRRGGDWRATVGAKLVHSGPDPWLNDFGEHQENIKRAIEG